MGKMAHLARLKGRSMLKRVLAKPIEDSVVEALVQSELADILMLCAPIKVYLFGSAARKEMTDASDIDLLVVLTDDSDLKQIKHQYYCRKKGHMYPVDMIFVHQSEFASKAKVGGVAMICEQEGRILLERTP